MKRVLTAALLIPFILYVVFLAPWWLLFGVTAVVALICYSEYCGMARAYGIEKLGWVGYGAGLLILAIKPQDGYLVFMLLALLMLLLGMWASDLAKSLPQRFRQQRARFAPCEAGRCNHRLRPPGTSSALRYHPN